MGVSYTSIVNATLSTILTQLAARGVGPARIVGFYHDGTNHVVVFVTQGQ